MRPSGGQMAAPAGRLEFLPMEAHIAMDIEAQKTIEGACASAKHDGTPIKMDGAWWVFPPLTVAQVRRLAPKVSKLGGKGLSLAAIGDFGEVIEPVVDILHAAIMRNYPALTRDAFEDMLDLASMQAASVALFQISGFVQGEGPAGNRSP